MAGNNTSPAHGSLILAKHGNFIYTPNPGFSGTNSFTYHASDGQAQSNVDKVTIRVVAKSIAQPATITIALDVQPDGKTNFNFAGSLGIFSLDDITPQDSDAYTNSKSFTVAAGVYTVTQALPGGWVNAKISCNPSANTVADLTKNQIAINAAGSANITCTFVTQRAGQLIAGAYNDHNHNHNRNNQWLRGWQMQLHADNSSVIATQVTNKEGRTTFNNLRPGSYTICEVVMAGWFTITPNTLDATYQQPCYTVTVEPDKAVWTRFGNSTDVVVCDLPNTDDDGNEVAPERDP